MGLVVADILTVPNQWWFLLGPLIGLVVVLLYVCQDAVNESGQRLSDTPGWKKWQATYVLVSALLSAVDYFSGPYVYAQMEECSIPPTDISYIFMAGYLCTAVFGVLLGYCGDKYGRKKLIVVYCILHIISSVLMNYCNLYGYALARVLAGLGNSILFSCVEAWLVKQIDEEGFNRDLLINAFSYGTMWNAITAIVSGAITTHISKSYGYTGNFNASIVVAVLAMIASASWPNNMGEPTKENFEVIKGILTTPDPDPEVKVRSNFFSLTIFLMFFESAMYIFVFMWNPLMDEILGHEPPIHLCYSTFMVCWIVGALLFKFYRKKGYSAEKVAVGASAGACVSLVLPAIFPVMVVSTLGFVVFSICVGMYIPIAGILKSYCVWEEARATFYTILRIGSNIIVALILFFLGWFTFRMIFALASFFCGVAFLAAFVLHGNVPATHSKVDSTDAEM